MKTPTRLPAFTPSDTAPSRDDTAPITTRLRDMPPGAYDGLADLVYLATSSAPVAVPTLTPEQLEAELAAFDAALAAEALAAVAPAPLAGPDQPDRLAPPDAAGGAIEVRDTPAPSARSAPRATTAAPAAPVVPLRPPHRVTRWTEFAAAACVLLALGGAGGSAWWARDVRARADNEVAAANARASAASARALLADARAALREGHAAAARDLLAALRTRHGDTALRTERESLEHDVSVALESGTVAPGVDGPCRAARPGGDHRAP